MTFFSTHHSPTTEKRKASVFTMGTVKLSSVSDVSLVPHTLTRRGRGGEESKKRHTGLPDEQEEPHAPRQVEQQGHGVPRVPQQDEGGEEGVGRWLVRCRGGGGGVGARHGARSEKG